VPGLNDSKEDIRTLNKIFAGLNYCEKFEFLPYHTLGKHKWEYMKIKYPLRGTPPAGPRHLEKAQASLVFCGASEKKG
jgi:pyruvate formate lyase activating enzyme